MFFERFAAAAKPDDESSLKRICKLIKLIVTKGGRIEERCDSQRMATWIQREGEIAMDDKVIVSNRSALIAKYARLDGEGRRPSPHDLCGQAPASEPSHLDNAAAMKKLKGKPVTVPSIPGKTSRQSMRFSATAPEYLMMLGAPDVIPHQDLRHLMYKKDDDMDAYAYGDLPHACGATIPRTRRNSRGPRGLSAGFPTSRAREPRTLSSCSRSQPLTGRAT